MERGKMESGRNGEGETQRLSDKETERCLSTCKVQKIHIDSANPSNISNSSNNSNPSK